jgi:diamine N-acetyltransferase
MIIHPITSEKLTELADVAGRAYRDHYLHLWHDNGNWYLDQFFSLQRFKDELNNPDFKFYLIYEGEFAVGFFKLNMRPHFGRHPDTDMEVERIYLMKEASGKGIGSQVMKEVESIAKEHHRTRLLLKVMDSSKDAIAFYKKLGYAIFGTHRLSFPQMKEEFRGMYMMTKDIK